MFKKRPKLIKDAKQGEMRSKKALSKEAEEALFERDLYDDHGPVIMGNRKARPKF